MYGVRPFRPADSDKTPCPDMLHLGKRNDVETLQAGRGQPTCEQALISRGSGPPATQFKLVAKVQTSQWRGGDALVLLAVTVFPFPSTSWGLEGGKPGRSRDNKTSDGSAHSRCFALVSGFTTETSSVTVSANQNGPSDRWAPARFPHHLEYWGRGTDLAVVFSPSWR